MIHESLDFASFQTHPRRIPAYLRAWPSFEVVLQSLVAAHSVCLDDLMTIADSEILTEVKKSETPVLTS